MMSSCVINVGKTRSIPTAPVAGAFRTRVSRRDTEFKRFYDRGDLPLQVTHHYHYAVRHSPSKPLPLALCLSCHVHGHSNNACIGSI
jgi:hypothetical protein